MSDLKYLQLTIAICFGNETNDGDDINLKSFTLVSDIQSKYFRNLIWCRSSLIKEILPMNEKKFPYCLCFEF